VRRRLKWAQWAAPPNDWRRPIAADAAWGAQLADRVVHAARGTPPAIGAAVEIVVVDDDAEERPDAAPASARRLRPRDAFGDALRTAGIEARRVESGDAGAATSTRVVALFGESHSWKGRADYAPEALRAVGAACAEAAAQGRNALVAQFGHPKYVGAIPGGVPVVCGWSGDRAMQQAVARWLVGRR
jgi:beta-glucosidase